MSSCLRPRTRPPVGAHERKEIIVLVYLSLEEDFSNWKIKQMTRDLYIFLSYRIVLSDEDTVGLMLFRKYDGSVFLILHLWLFSPWKPLAYHSIYQKDACFVLTRKKKQAQASTRRAKWITFLCYRLVLQHGADILMLPFHSISIFAEIHFHLLRIKKL